jgi:thymidylate synthase
MQFRSVNEALPSLAHMLLTEGTDVPSRVGATKELTFQHFTITDPLQREIVVEGRKANIAAQIAETMWVLSGRNDVEWLSAYLPRAADFSDDGTTWRAGYGPRLRNWQGELHGTGIGADQMMNIIRLLQEDPGTRRAVMSLWAPYEDVAPSKDIPCNNWLHFLSRDNVLDLHVAIRSNDLVWGWSGINQFEWSVLLEVVAHYAGLQVGGIHYAVSSLHMYDRHWDKAPTWKVRTVHTQRDRRFDSQGLDWDMLCAAWFKLEDRIRNVGTKCTGPGCDGCVLAKDIAAFPDPMLRSWLNVLGWWWTGQGGWLHSVQDSRLWHAAQVGTGPKARPAAPQTGADAASGTLAAYTGAGATRPQVQRAHPANAGRFVQEVIQLHIDKDRSYGTSWKKRGELFSILPNIARKADRLGAGETTDENQTDTAVDLMVYLAKYRTFLLDASGRRSDITGPANELIRSMVDRVVLMQQPETTTELEDLLRAGVDEMMDLARKAEPDRDAVVERLARDPCPVRPACRCGRLPRSRR